MPASSPNPVVMSNPASAPVSLTRYLIEEQRAGRINAELR